ncbi:phytanoyl-CoA dioxygenase family protein [Actinopolymorpha sp. B17G11]|uniref:phytanoyl-CoA dioxygenase family protein n=1 Tax=Actinopolymorpha sp. B17G11 TaxID=3160861 RepID=UPI0032E39549
MNVTTPEVSSPGAEAHGEGLLDDARLSATLRTFRDSGMVIIRNAYDADRIATLRASYDDLLAQERAAPNGSRSVQPTDGQNHIQMQMPLVPPFADVDVVAHPVVAQVLAAVLGTDYRCCLYNSNTAFPGSTHQQVHRDAGPVFGSGLGVPTPTTGVVLNIPLCDFTEENGSTEVWPGSHLIVDHPDDAGAELTDRARALASARFNIPVGAIALRDLRLWHRGTPNQSDGARTMVAIVYQRSWLGWRSPALRVPAQTWRAWPSHVQTVFAAAPVDD